MKFSIVENVPTSRDSILMLSPPSQLPYTEKSMRKNNLTCLLILYKKCDFTIGSPYFPGWGHAGVICMFLYMWILLF